MDGGTVPPGCRTCPASPGLRLDQREESPNHVLPRLVEIHARLVCLRLGWCACGSIRPVALAAFALRSRLLRRLVSLTCRLTAEPRLTFGRTPSADAVGPSLDRLELLTHHGHV